MPSQEIFILAIYFLDFEGLENLLEERGQINSRGHAMTTSRGALPPLSSTMSSRGEEALGGWSLKDGAWSSEAEWDGATTSAPFFLLKTRPMQVSSSSEAMASTAPFLPLIDGGWFRRDWSRGRRRRRVRRG